MRYLTHEDVQRELLSLLCDFDKFVSEHKLRYTLDAGTLLGAVRHGGFIPWDDDIDVAMPRSDYQKLITLKQLLPEDICLMTLSDESPFPFLKFCRTNIRCQEADLQGSGVAQKLWIDVFPLDGVSDDEDERYLQHFKVDKLKRRALRLFVPARSGWKTIPKTIYQKVMSAFTSYLKIYERIDAIAQEIPFGVTRYCRDVVWSMSPRTKYLTEDFDNLVCLKFCGEEFSAVEHWDETLNWLYGDYMVLPPENQRITHGIVAWYCER